MSLADELNGLKLEPHNDKGHLFLTDSNGEFVGRDTVELKIVLDSFAAVRGEELAMWVSSEHKWE